MQFNLRKMYTSMEDPLENVFEKKLYGRVYDVLSPLFLLAKECAQGEVMFLSTAIQNMGEKAREGAAREKVVIVNNDQRDDQIVDGGVEEDEKRDLVPAAVGSKTPSKRRRDESEEEPSASHKKRKC